MYIRTYVKLPDVRPTPPHVAPSHRSVARPPFLAGPLQVLIAPSRLTRFYALPPLSVSLSPSPTPRHLHCLVLSRDDCRPRTSRCISITWRLSEKENKIKNKNKNKTKTKQKQKQGVTNTKMGTSVPAPPLFLVLLPRCDSFTDIASFVRLIHKNRLQC